MAAASGAEAGTDGGGLAAASGAEAGTDGGGLAAALGAEADGGGLAGATGAEAGTGGPAAVIAKSSCMIEASKFSRSRVHCNKFKKEQLASST